MFIESNGARYAVNICGTTLDGNLSIGFKDISIADAFKFASDESNTKLIKFVRDSDMNSDEYRGYTELLGIHKSMLGTVVTLKEVK